MKCKLDGIGGWRSGPSLITCLLEYPASAGVGSANGNTFHVLLLTGTFFPSTQNQFTFLN
jgi:hypothetical protein